MDKLKYIKLENEDGSYSNSIPLAVNSDHVDMANGKDLQDTIGTINVDIDGSIAEQLGKYKDYDSDIETLYADVDNLKGKDTDLENDIIDLQVNKINKIDIIDNLNSSSNTKVLSAKQGKVLGDAVTALEAENVKKKPYYFDNVENMKAATYLKVGDMVITLGYYETNDGGNSEYRIVDGNYTDNSGSYHQLDNNLFAELIIDDDNNINVKQFGAYGDGVHDDTEKIQNAIDNLQINQTLYIPSGNYKLSRQGSFITSDFGNYTSNYCLLINNKNNIKIICEGVLTPDLSNINTNILSLKECYNIIIDGLKSENIGSTFEGTFLHNKFLLYCYKSNNIYAHNIISKNTGGNTCFTICKNCVCENSKSSRSSYDYKSPALFGCYASQNIKFDKCDCYGSCDDGDISIFGNCVECDVINCSLYNCLENDDTKTIVVNTLQGICVDSGCCNCNVINNLIYGYFYGIDIKTDCENILVSENQCIKNKISIACRMGEGKANTFNTSIINNIIAVNNGNGNQIEFLSGYKNYGIYGENQKGISILNNLIGNDTSSSGYTIPFIPIYLNDDSSINIAYDKLNLINNNTINLEDRKGTYHAYSNSPAIYIKGTSLSNPIRNYNISNNTIKSPYQQNLTNYDINVLYGKNITINNNKFSDKPQGVGFIYCSDCEEININNNDFKLSTYNFKVMNTNNLTINNNNMIAPDINYQNTGAINGCNNVIIKNNFYRCISENETDILVIQGSNNVIVDNNVAITNQDKFFAAPSSNPNTNAVESNTIIWSQ